MADRVSDAASLTGLLLVLVTLFTSEQARSLDNERRRLGGAEAGSRKRIRTLALALAAVTLLCILALAPLVAQIIKECCSGAWNPVRALFLLVWVLLFPLIIWQLSIAKGASSLSG